MEIKKLSEKCSDILELIDAVLVDAPQPVPVRTPCGVTFN